MTTSEFFASSCAIVLQATAARSPIAFEEFWSQRWMSQMFRTAKGGRLRVRAVRRFAGNGFVESCASVEAARSTKGY